jgi:hypothetical protein
MGKTDHKVCKIHKYPVSMMPHKRSIHRPAEEHGITGSVLHKNTIQKPFHGWCMVYIKQEHYQAKITIVGVQKIAMQSLLPITLTFSTCAQNSTVCWEGIGRYIKLNLTSLYGEFTGEKLCSAILISASTERQCSEIHCVLTYFAALKVCFTAAWQTTSEPHASCATRHSCCDGRKHYNRYNLQYTVSCGQTG